MFETFFKAVAGLTKIPQRAGFDGEKVGVRALRDGSLITADWIHAACLAGKVFVGHMGTAETPISWANTAYDADQPDLVLDVPKSKIVIPIFWEVNVVASGAAVFRADLMASPLTVLDLTACAATKVAPVNVRPSCGKVSSCAFAHSVTVNGNDPTAGAAWITHQGNQGDIDAIALSSQFSWSVRTAGYLPVVDGGSVVGYIFNGTSGSGYSKLVWAEFDAEEFAL